MVWRNSRGTPVNAPAAFINPCHTKDGSAIIDTEVVWLGSDGVADFDALHSRVSDGRATACAFDLLMLNGEDGRSRLPNARPCCAKCCAVCVAAFNTSTTPRATAAKLFKAICHLGLKGIVSKKLDAPYRSGPSKNWIEHAGCHACD